MNSNVQDERKIIHTLKLFNHNYKHHYKGELYYVTCTLFCPTRGNSAARQYNNINNNKNMIIHKTAIIIIAIISNIFQLWKNPKLSNLTRQH